MKPSRLVLKPSYYLACLLGLVSILAVLLLLTLPMLFWLKLALLGLVVTVSTYLILRDALLALPNAWREISLNQKDEISLTQQNGLSFVATIQHSSVVMPFLTVLNVKLSGRFWSSSLILLPDSADADAFRRWRVWLKWALKPKSQFKNKTNPK